MRWKRGIRLRLVDEANSPPGTREIFEQVRHSLGVPVVPLLYRAYAAFPKFLEIHWQAFRPVVETQPFFLLGSRIAAEAYTRVHNYFTVPGLVSQESSPSDPLPLSLVLDYYQYLDPLLLLIAVSQVQAFESTVGGENAHPEPARHLSFLRAPVLLADAQAPPEIREIWDQRCRSLELGLIADEHRALACWPQFYQNYWAVMKDLVQSPLFADCEYRINESVWSLASELPAPVETSFSELTAAGLDARQISTVTRLTQAFVQTLAGLLLDITFARIACEGGTSRDLPRHKAAAPEAQLKPTGSPTRAA
jgi:hypothetical protein